MPANPSDLAEAIMDMEPEAIAVLILVRNDENNGFMVGAAGDARLDREVFYKVIERYVNQSREKLAGRGEFND